MTDLEVVIQEILQDKIAIDFERLGHPGSRRETVRKMEEG